MYVTIIFKLSIDTSKLGNSNIIDSAVSQPVGAYCGVTNCMFKDALDLELPPVASPPVPSPPVALAPVKSNNNQSLVNIRGDHFLDKFAVTRSHSGTMQKPMRYHLPHVCLLVLHIVSCTANSWYKIHNVAM